MNQINNTLYSARKNYFASGMALCITAFGYAVLRLLGALGMYRLMPPTAGNILGSVLVQVVLMLGVSLVVNLLNEYNKPVFKFMEWGGASGIAIDESGPAKGGHKSKIIRSLQSIGFRMPDKIMWPLSVLIGVLFIFFTIGVSIISMVVLTMLGYNFNAGGSDLVSTTVGLFLLYLFLSAVLPSVCEEVLHRGVMLKGLKESMSDEQVVVMTGLIFGLAHAYIGQTLYTFVGGIILAILAVRTKSIYPPMIVHFINNGFSVYMEHARLGGWPGYAEYSAAYSWLINNMMVGVMLWLLCAAAMFLLVMAVWRSAGSIKKAGPQQQIIRYDANGRPYIPAPTVMPSVSQSVKKYRPRGIENIPLFTGVFLLGLLTLFSFIWGLF